MNLAKIKLFYFSYLCLNPEGFSGVVFESDASIVDKDIDSQSQLLQLPGEACY